MPQQPQESQSEEKAGLLPQMPDGSEQPEPMMRGTRRYNITHLAIIIGIFSIYFWWLALGDMTMELFEPKKPYKKVEEKLLDFVDVRPLHLAPFLLLRVSRSFQAKSSSGIHVTSLGRTSVPVSRSQWTTTAP